MRLFSFRQWKRAAAPGLALLGASALAGCGAANPGGFGALAYDCPADAEARLVDVEWDKAETFTVLVRDDAYVPMAIRLRKDRAYVIRFENRDDYSHRFFAAGFFRSVALKGVQVEGGKEDPKSCIRGLGLPAGQAVTVRLVTVREGRYPFEESALGTYFLGTSFGVIVVE